jgi:hypothetical protein
MKLIYIALLVIVYGSLHVFEVRSKFLFVILKGQVWMYFQVLSGFCTQYLLD